MEIRIGTSGFHYKHWKGIFYPKGYPTGNWLSYYAGKFDTVEINNTFYRLPKEETFIEWKNKAPKGFLYALKFSKYGTHNKKLLQPHETIDYFLSRANRLGALLGPILVQLGPNFKKDGKRLSEFLYAAPTEYRWAIEFRNTTWLCDEIYDILNKHSASLCIHDMIPYHPDIVTAKWVYLRFHGSVPGGSYSEDRLKAISKNILKYRKDRLDIYAYFNNDIGGHAIFNALQLKEMIREWDDSRG